LAAILGGTTHSCDHSSNDLGCVAANTKINYWWITCDCHRKYDCDKCNNTGKLHPDRCPNFYYDTELDILRKLYDSFTNKNILPYSGSQIDQPRKIFKEFDAINLSIYHRQLIDKQAKDERDDIITRINKGKN
jgi:hypothetical protein